MAAATVRLTWANSTAAGVRTRVLRGMRCAPDRIIDVLGRRAASLPREAPLSHRSLLVDFDEITSVVAHTLNHTQERTRIINVIIIVIIIITVTIL